MARPGRQAGAALVSALLIVAVAAITAASLVGRQEIEIRRSANLIHGEQGTVYAVAAETWARQLLARNAAATEVDHLQERWAMAVPPVQIDGGALAGGVDDLQGRLNLNNLAAGDGVDEVALAQFQRLLAILDLEPGIAAAVADWVRAGADPLPGGADDGYYMARDPPYRAANAPMAHVSELRLVRGVDAAAYEALESFVTALPGRTGVNVNTAPPAVLGALADEIGPDGGTALAAMRDGEPFGSVEGFIDTVTERFGDEAAEALPGDTLAVRSDYFQVTAEARFGEGRRVMVSDVAVMPGGVTVLRRMQGG